MLMDAYNIQVQLSSILRKRANIDFNTNSELRDEKLLGQKIGMPARELVLTLFDIEREFNTKIPEQDIIDGTFDTFNNILKIIEFSLAT